MDITLLLKALIQGVVEGLTEFLPVSSTGHLIVSGALIGFDGEKAKVFEIVIQSGAILAICYEYRERLHRVISGLVSDASAQRFSLNIIIAFLPAAFLGLFFSSFIKHYLFNPLSVALAFIVGGIIILWAENREHEDRITCVDNITPLDALKIGLAQCAALIPGTSRSGATIIGGLLFGFSRTTATEFSFFLAIPTIFAATLYDGWKHRELLSVGDLPMFTVGFIAAFISALLAVRGLLRFIATHSFVVFAWYRIGFGLLILLLAYTNLMVW